MVYQTVLLAHRHSLRTGSLDESVTPNTSPAQWPGISNLHIWIIFLALLEVINGKKQIWLSFTIWWSLLNIARFDTITNSMQILQLHFNHKMLLLHKTLSNKQYFLDHYIKVAHFVKLFLKQFKIFYQNIYAINIVTEIWHKFNFHFI